jgi:type IV fimbrial biogenesis protein FimT
MRTQRAFTMIELLTTLAVAAVLASFAGPSISTMIQNNRITSNANDMLADFAMARSEAAKRGFRVVICKADPTQSTPTCSGSYNWQDGWIVYVDANSNGNLESTEEVLRTHDPLPTGTVITPSNTSAAYTVKPVGTVTPVSTFTICDNRSGQFGRQLSIAATGRPSITSGIQCN